MSKVKTSVHFKRYNPTENLLLPPNLDELIGPSDLVRVVSRMVDRWDLTSLINQYCGGGCPAYHPKMLLKVLLYAYSCKIYTGRQIARALTKDIHFMWLSAQNRPDYRTINNFRSGRAKKTIESLFTEMLKCLLEDKYISMENYFCDGSTFFSNGNPTRIQWKKSAMRYKEIAELNCQELFKEIDELNDQEEKLYGQANLEQTGEQSAEVSEEKMAERTKKFNEVIKKATDVKIKKKAESLKVKIERQQEKIKKYRQQIETSGDRSGFNVTDTDASAMRMKDGRLLGGYNVLAGCENQFIINCSVHQNTNDGACFKDHVDQLEKISPVMPGTIVADSVFGTEDNYDLMAQKQINNYLKYPTLHEEEKPHYTPKPFSNASFDYDPFTNTYICPNKRVLNFIGEEKSEKRKNGHQSTYKKYQCNNCSGCPFKVECCEQEKNKNRIIRVNPNLEMHRKQAAQNLRSSLGWELRKRRNIEIESCFGDIKENMGIRRCHLRGLLKVKTDFCLISMAHNLRKIHLLLKNVA